MKRRIGRAWALAILVLAGAAGCGQTFQCKTGDPIFEPAEKRLTCTCDGKPSCITTWEQTPRFKFKCPAGQRPALDAQDQPTCRAAR